MQKSRCTHRGAAATRATARAAAAVHLAHNPGVSALGQARREWLREHLDSDDPQGFFVRSGWTGKGSHSCDADTLRITRGSKGPAEAHGVVLRRGAKKPRKAGKPRKSKAQPRMRTKRLRRK